MGCSMCAALKICGERGGKANEGEMWVKVKETMLTFVVYLPTRHVFLAIKRRFCDDKVSPTQARLQRVGMLVTIGISH